MSKPQVKIVNVETGEEIVRDATAAEIKQIELDAAEELAQRTAQQNKVLERQAILDRLGITAEEAALILG